MGVARAFTGARAWKPLYARDDPVATSGENLPRACQREDDTVVYMDSMATSNFVVTTASSAVPTSAISGGKPSGRCTTS